jgi:hypothetical protein
MRYYIVTRIVVTPRKNDASQADAPTSPALSLARKVNRIAFTPSGESSKHYTRAEYVAQLKKALWSIKRFLRDYAAALRSLECAPLVSRAHCNEVRYLYENLGGETAC